MTIYENNSKVKLYNASASKEILTYNMDRSLSKESDESTNLVYLITFYITTDSSNIADVITELGDFINGIERIESYIKEYDSTTTSFKYTISSSDEYNFSLESIGNCIGTLNSIHPYTYSITYKATISGT